MQWSEEWKQVPLLDTISTMFTGISSCILVGEELSLDPTWLQVVQDYNATWSRSLASLQPWPAVLRPYVARLLPNARKLNATASRARKIVNRVLEERRARRAMQPEDVASSTSHMDALQWVDEIAEMSGVRYDAAVIQLGLALAAVNTVVDMVTQLVIDLCGRDKLIADLRAEIKEHVQERGLRRSTLYELKLLDSVMKESQRLKPLMSGESRTA